MKKSKDTPEGTEFVKPKKFRDRKTYSAKDTLSPGEAKHPLRTPYKRTKTIVVEDEQDYGCVDDPWCPLCNGFEDEHLTFEDEEPQTLEELKKELDGESSTDS